jgi:amino-acid N-acetyltransferase
MEIRAIRPEEFGQVLDLLGRSRLPVAGLADHAGDVLVAVDRDRVIGSAGLEVYGEAALLRSVAVEPAFQGRGIGRALAARALELARARGVTAVYLLTETAAAFFERLGFRPIPRVEAEPAVGRSLEFQGACPASAACMVLVLEGAGAGQTSPLGAGRRP